MLHYLKPRPMPIAFSSMRVVCGALRMFAFSNLGPSDALGRALAAALLSLPGAEAFGLAGSGLGEGAAAELRAAKAAAEAGAPLPVAQSSAARKTHVPLFPHPRISFKISQPPRLLRARSGR